MSKLPETRAAVLMEKQNWENIIHTDEWVVFRRLLKEHADFLQKEANEHLRKQNNVEAFGSLRAMDDANKILTLVTQRISALNREAEKGE